MNLLLACCLLTSARPEEPVADVVTLRDGTEVRGIVDEKGHAGVSMGIRRDWAANHQPDRLKGWERAEAPFLKRARGERLSRLQAWRRDRRDDPGGGPDEIAAWLDERIKALSDPDLSDEKSELMMVVVGRKEIERVDDRPESANRLLKLGWRAGFRDVESMESGDLADALRGRSFDVDGDAAVAVDDLLPIPIETETRWLARRAATEAARDPGLRFINYGGFVLAEPAAGAALDVGDALGGLMGSLLGDPAAAAGDPLSPKLRSVETRGRVGAIVTRLELTPDLTGARVEMTLLVRVASGRWEPAASRASTVDSRNLPPGAGANIAADPQVKAVFGAIEGLGLGGLNPEMKNQGLSVGAATQAALGQARSMLQADLEALALPVGESEGR